MARRCELTGKGVLTGNNVSHAHNKTRRRFLPNVQEMALHSETLGRSVRLKVCVSALRTIEKKGGLDAFLSDAKDSQLSLKARRLKRAVGKATESAAVEAAA
jgi:large subunit ribosomal protein L28